MSAVATRGRLRITSPLGADKLFLTAFTGREEMSRLFEFRLELLSEEQTIAPASIIGKPVTFWVERDEGDARYFHGHVSRFWSGGTSLRGLRAYRMQIVPWLWFLTRTTDCRIFQNKTIPQIIEQIFGDLGFSDFELSVEAGEAIEYCVQYRETDFQFVSRLMEHMGYYYFFRHENGKHTLVVSDKTSSYATCLDAEVPFVADSNWDTAVSEWEYAYEFRSGKTAHTDYNFTTPTTSLLANSNSVVAWPDMSKYELYDYPGQYATRGDGTHLADVRMAEEESPHAQATGAGTCVSFVPGHKFTPSNMETATELGSTFVLLDVEHQCTDDSYLASKSTQFRYRNAFRCAPAATLFRPARRTPKPVVQGPQTAVVVGPSGEEMYTDEYGRVKVQFHWDREGQKNEQSSCWIRVAQNWAGKGWGIVFHPRIGQEVIVEFLEGDPDRPIITGRVYNADQTVPYALPANQTQSVIKTRSTKNGDADTFNELRFEDNLGSEEIYLHAEKDFNRVVENNDTLKVGFEKKDPGEQRIEIYGDRTEIVESGNESVTIKQGNRTIVVEQGNDNHQVKTGNRDVILDKGNDALTITAGNQAIKLDAGSSTTEAAQAIELKVGGNKIVINQQGITISGAMVKIEATAQLELSGAMSKVAGSGGLELQGAIVKIN